MRVAIIGATGTIGREVVKALGARHEVVEASRQKASRHLDMADPSSIRAFYKELGTVDAVVVAAGPARFAPLAKLTDEDFRFCLDNKLMGQVNLVRYGVEAVKDGGSFTLTSGILAQKPIPGSGAISLVNAGVEGFTRAAALELPRRLRINCVSPGWVAETLKAMGQSPAEGVPAADVARVYVASVEGSQTGAVLPAIKG